MSKHGILVVGIGGHARAWKKNIDAHPDWEIVGIVDTDTEKLEMEPSSWGVPEDNAFPTITTAMRFMEEEVEAVLITTPIYTHHVLATEAIEQGLNVIVEKNMASTVEQGQALVKLARAHPDLCTAVGTQYRFRPLWWTLRNLLLDANGPIGQLSSFRIRSMAYSGDSRHGWRQWLPDIYPEDMMAHHIDSLRYCTGLEIIKVQAQVFKPSWSKWLGSSTVIANFTMAPRDNIADKETWVRGQYYGSWQGTGLKRPWEDDWEFFGPQGSLRVEPPAIPQEGFWAVHDGRELIGEPAGSQIALYRQPEHPQHTPATREVLTKRTDIENNPDGYLDQLYILDEMAKGIEANGRVQPQTRFAEAFKSFMVTRGAIMSSQTNQTVWLPNYWPDPIPEPF